MGRKLGTSVRNSDGVKQQSAKFEPSTVRYRTMQNLAHLQTETTRTICTCSKTLENKPVTQKAKVILGKIRETEPITKCRRITRFRSAGTQQNALQNQAIGRKIVDVPPIRTSAPIIALPKKQDQVPSSIRSLVKSEAIRKVGANRIKAHAVAVKTQKQTAGVKVQHNPLPSKESSPNGSYQYMLGGKDPAQVPGCSTSALHKRLCYDKVQRERIRKANIKKNRSMPEGACSILVKQAIPHSDDICPAALRKGKPRNVRRKLVFDEDVSKELEKSLQEEQVTIKHGHQQQETQRERIRKANIKKNRSMPEGACSTPVKQTIPHSDDICPAALRKGKSRNVRRKLVFDEDVSKELEKSLQEEQVTIKHGHQQQETQEESFIESSATEKQIVSYNSYRGKTCPPALIKAKSTSYFDGRAGSSSVCRKPVFDEDVSSSSPIERKSMSCFDGETLSYSLSGKVIFDEDLEADAPPAFKSIRKVTHETETLSKIWEEQELELEQLRERVRAAERELELEQLRQRVRAAELELEQLRERQRAQVLVHRCAALQGALVTLHAVVGMLPAALGTPRAAVLREALRAETETLSLQFR